MQPILICSTFRITRLHFTYKYPSVSAAYVCYIYLQNKRITLHLWVSYFKCSSFLFAGGTEPKGYTKLKGVAPSSAAHFCLLEVHNHKVTLHLRVFHLKSSLMVLCYFQFQNHLLTHYFWVCNVNCCLLL